MNRMNRLAPLISLLSTLCVGHSALAGPESGINLLAGTPAEFAEKGKVETSAAVAASMSFEDLLADPSFAGPQNQTFNAELSGTEHPMIPLPSNVVAGFLLFAGVTGYVLRQQRAPRLR
jgi:hypothetical protein